MSITNNSRNGTIELLRFFAAVCIAVYHFEWIYIGHPVYFVHFYIWVEFFFVLSGFFLAFNCVKPHICSGKNNNNVLPAEINYTIGEFKKLYPMYFVAFIWSFFALHIENHASIYSILGDLWKSKWEILLCNVFMFDSDKTLYNVTSTYVASLLFSSLLLFYLIRNRRKLFVCVLGPAMVFIGYGRIIKLYGNLSQWLNDDGFVTASLIRALAGMSLGALCYLLITEIIRTNKPIHLLLCICGLTSIPILVLFRDNISFSDLVIWPFLFGGLLSSLYIPFSLSEKKIKRKAKNIKLNSILCGLGKLSYPIFLFHYGLLIIMKNYYPNLSYKNMILFFVFFIMLIANLAILMQKIIMKYKKNIESSS